MWSFLSGQVDVGVRLSVQRLQQIKKTPMGRRAPGETLRQLQQLARQYPEAAEDFHLAPAPIAPQRSPLPRPRALADGGALWQLRWPSEAPAYDAQLRLGDPRANRVAVARWWRHPGVARPAVILVHGWGAGQWRLEARIWPIKALYRSGLDVLQFQLPLHGERAQPGRRGLPDFPSGHPGRTLERFRQAVYDLRNLVRFVRAEGGPAVALWGMSLGSYLSALTATQEPIDALALTIPLASLVDFSYTRQALAPGAVGEAQAALLRRVYRPIDPLLWAPRVAPERVITVTAEHDGITPVAHGAWLAAHFGGARLNWPGGHLVGAGRGPGWATLCAHTGAALR